MNSEAGEITKADKAELVLPASVQDITLPLGWEWANLGDICKTTSGGTPSRKFKEYFDGQIPWVKSGELPDGPVTEIEEYITDQAVKNSSAKLFPAGTLLIALYGATVGKLGILTHDATTNQAVCALFPSNNVHTKYLFWYLRHVRSDLIAKAIGGAQPNINQGILRSLRIPIAPLDQQKRIVAEIEKQFSRLDKAVANLKRVKANLKRYKAAVLKAAVEGKLTEEWRKTHPDVEPASELLKRILVERRAKWNGKGKYKEPPGPDARDLPSLPKNWIWASLEQISWHSSYGTSAKCSYENTGPPVLRIPNIAGGRIDLSDLKYATQEECLDDEDQLATGDLLIIRTNGSKNLIGRSAIVREKFNRHTSYASYLIRFRLVPETTLFGWLTAIWDCSFLRTWIEQRAATSAGQHNVSMSVLNTLPVPLPPVVEQERIVTEVERRLSVIEQLEVLIASNFKRGECLRQTLLGSAFNGKLVSGGTDLRA